jgi:hypothetical protein
MPASKTLIPVNSAILIGGMATTIGTSTNLLVVSIASDMGMRQMAVFEFTPIVLMAAAVALPFIWLVMPACCPTIRATPIMRRADFTRRSGSGAPPRRTASRWQAAGRLSAISRSTASRPMRS